MKNLKYLYFLIIGSFVLMNFKCYKEDDTNSWLVIDNKLNKSFFCICSNNIRDTNLTYISKSRLIANENSYKVFPNSKVRLKNCWVCGPNAIIKFDTLLITLIEQEVLLNNSWETIVNKDLVYNRYFITDKDIETCQFEISQ